MRSLRIHHQRRDAGPTWPACGGSPSKRNNGATTRSDWRGLAATGPSIPSNAPGPATANLGDLDACRGAAVVIGHCRWATHGAPEDNRNNHPHPAGRGWFVHNGVVRNHASLIHQFRLAPQTQCDSEVLGLLIARFPGALGLRAARAAEVAEGPLAMLGLWRKPARLLSSATATRSASARRTAVTTSPACRANCRARSRRSRTTTRACSSTGTGNSDTKPIRSGGERCDT